MRNKRFTFIELICMATFIMIIAMSLQIFWLRQDNSKNKRRSGGVERVEVPVEKIVEVEKWPDQFIITGMEFYSDRNGNCYWQYIKMLRVKNTKTGEERLYTWEKPEACR